MTHGQIPFNTIEATKLYEQYVNDGDATALSKLVEQSRDLCSMHALRLANGNQDVYLDLVQEGMLRCYEIYRNRRYNPDKGSLFTLLNNAIPRRMIDVLRQSSRHDFTTEDCIDDSEHLDTDSYHPIGQSTVYRNGDSDETIIEFQQQAIAYSVKRFPSLPMMNDVGQYVTEAILDGQKPIGIANTLRTIYDIKSGKVVYDAIRTRFAAELAHRQVFEDAAITAVNQRTEFTSKPEWCLILGPTLYRELQYYIRRV